MSYIKFSILAVFLMVSLSPAAPPKNVILLIGDGMGPEEVKAAGMYANGAAGTLSFETLPYQAECSTYSANSSVTDSAAAATAIATGQKVNNDVISIATPGDGSELETLLEYFKDRGKSTGLVTTTYISHATPAGFGAHEPSRSNYNNIVDDYLTQTLPNVMMGGAKYLSSAEAAFAGYTVVTSRSAMQSLDTNAVAYVSGQFGSDYMPYEYDGLGVYPHLREMTETALDILDNDPDGFFLMVEGGRIDHAGHASDLPRNIAETIEFSNAVQVALDWAAGRTDTLVLVTADHETGGLIVLQNNGQGVYPTVNWTSGGSHTGVNVPVYAIGMNAERIFGTLDNTDFFDICISDEMPADLDGDMCVDLADFCTLANQWQNPMDIFDLQMIADAWLSGVNQFALWFDGIDDYVEVSGFTGISGGQARTTCAWIRTSRMGGSILSYGDGTSLGDWLFLVSSTGTLQLGVSGGNTKGTTFIADNQWHHVAAVLETPPSGPTIVQDLRLYVDGALENGTYANPSFELNTGSTLPVQIGTKSNPRNYFYQGLIDDVRMYNRALSAAEICSITTVTEGLTAHWKLDEGIGTTVQDSASDYTGTIYGAPWLHWR